MNIFKKKEPRDFNIQQAIDEIVSNFQLYFCEYTNQSLLNLIPDDVNFRDLAKVVLGDDCFYKEVNEFLVKTQNNVNFT